MSIINKVCIYNYSITDCTHQLKFKKYMNIYSVAAKLYMSGRELKCQMLASEEISTYIKQGENKRH
jgi:hypothetical protein